ncbi:MAG: hypothetical protein C5S40_06850 [ANME-2 cluster archaeon]|nr:hypothetical protein [ANME-2 cluster archaeon]
MKYIALTGISSQVLKELQDNRIRTLEIRSPHNFYSVYGSDVGDLVLLTRTSYNDVRAGTIGLIAKIRSKQVAIHHLMQMTEDVFEECETFSTRLQLELKSLGRVRKVEENVLGKPFIVEADEVTYLEAR